MTHSEFGLDELQERCCARYPSRNGADIGRRSLLLKTKQKKAALHSIQNLLASPPGPQPHTNLNPEGRVPGSKVR